MKIFGQEKTKIENKDEEVLGTASSEVNALKPKTEEEKKEQKIISAPDKDHETLIVPHKSGRYNFIVNCKCHWQGRAVNIADANILAANHREARKKMLS